MVIKSDNIYNRRNQMILVRFNNKTCVSYYSLAKIFNQSHTSIKGKIFKHKDSLIDGKHYFIINHNNAKILLKEEYKGTDGARIITEEGILFLAKSSYGSYAKRYIEVNQNIVSYQKAMNHKLSTLQHFIKYEMI